MNKQCKICKETVNRKKPGMQCSGFCERFFHGQCLGIAGKQLDSLRVDGIMWKCSDCRDGARSRYSLTTPVDSSPPVDKRSTADTSTKRNYPERSISNNDLMAAMETITAELRAIREQQVVLSNSVTFCSDKVSDFEEKLIKINEWMRATDKILKENAKLKTDVANLELKLSDLEQSSRLNNIEIQGIPEKQNENLKTVIHEIGNYINYSIASEKIEYVHRVQLNKNSNNKIKNIIVRFNNRNEKENFLAAAKQKRMRKENGSPRMEIKGISDNFYINEHLTLENKILFKQTRSVAKEKHYKYTWTKNGMVFIRKDDTSRIVLVRNTNILENL